MAHEFLKQVILTGLATSAVTGEIERQAEIDRELAAKRIRADRLYRVRADRENAALLAFLERKRRWSTFRSADYENLDNTDERVLGGWWFTSDGIGFPIGNETETSAPAIYLSRYAKLITPHYRLVREWIDENPPPNGSTESIIQWYSGLARELIAEGWHFLFRWMLLTGSSIETASNDFRQLDVKLKDRGSEAWADNTLIAVSDIYDSDPAPYAIISWREFKEGAFDGDSQQKAVDRYEALLKLDELRKRGILTDEEFAAEKKRLLAKS